MTWTPIHGEGWPTPDQALLVRAAVLEGPDALTAWQEWRSRNTIASADGTDFPLLPAVFVNLRSARIHHVDRAALLSVYRWSWAQGQHLMGRLASALETLEKAGVTTMVIKGVPLALTHYRDVAGRVMLDTDLLIRPGDVPAAFEALDRDGWAFARAVAPQEYSRLHHELPLSDGQREAVDLHWRLFPVALPLDAECWLRAKGCDVEAPAL